MLTFQLIRIFTLSALSFFLAVILSPIFFRLILKLNLRKHIRKENAPLFSKLHALKEGTPTCGGIIVWVSVGILIAFIFLFSKIFGGFFEALNLINRAQTYLPIAAFFGAAILGLFDDLLEIYKQDKKIITIPRKILIYSFIAFIGAFWFYWKLNWDVVYFPVLGLVSLSWLYIFLFALVMIFCAFSSNETDGLDGLCGGVMLIAFFPLIVITFCLQRYDLACFLAMIEGALVAFLWENVYPAKFFGGDTLSMSLGICFGVVLMLTNTLWLLPFLGIIFFLESGSVILQVFSKKFLKKKIFLSSPIHHHFQAKGICEPKIVFWFWIIEGIGASLALIFFFLDKFI